MARRELEPKTEMAARLREVRRVLGDLDRVDMAKTLGVSKSTLSYYERGESEPTASVLAAYRRHYGVNVDYILTGHGTQFLGENVDIGGGSYSELRHYVWNIAKNFWLQKPRRTDADQFAHEFVEMLDYLVTRPDAKEGAVSQVVNFAVELQKRTSGKDGP